MVYAVIVVVSCLGESNLKSGSGLHSTGVKKPPDAGYGVNLGITIYSCDCLPHMCRKRRGREKFCVLGKSCPVDYCYVGLNAESRLPECGGPGGIWTQTGSNHEYYQLNSFAHLWAS